MTKEIYKLEVATAYQIDHEGVRTLWHRSMDGMYSFSKDVHGNTVNLHLTTKVQPIARMSYDEFVMKYGTEELKNTNNP